MVSKRYEIAHASFLFTDENGNDAYRDLQERITIDVPEPLFAATMFSKSVGLDVVTYRAYTGLSEITDKWGEYEDIHGIVLNYLVLECLEAYAIKKYKNEKITFRCVEEWHSADD